MIQSQIMFELSSMIRSETIQASPSLSTFICYVSALTINSRLYNKWIILSLESMLVLLWFVSLILLAGWTAAGYLFPLETIDVVHEPISYSHGPVIHSRWAGSSKLLFSAIRRSRVVPSVTPVRVHGQVPRDVTKALAVVAAGLSAINL